MVVKRIEEVPLDFHARYSARSKVYEYRIWNHHCRSPLLDGSTYHVPYVLNLAAMRKAARLFVGKHDFSSFTSVSAIKKDSSRVRTIKRFQIKRQGHLVLMHVEADGFLYHMVRNMVGTILEVGRGKRKPSDIMTILKAKARRFSGSTAPSEGLTLASVAY